MRMKRSLILCLMFGSFAIFLLCPLNVTAKIVFDAKIKHAGDTLYHIYAMEDDGSNLRRITPAHHYDTAAQWFPDGKRIVFERDWRKGKWNTGETMHREFFIIDATGINEHSFMDNHRTDTNPAPSPDGRYITFKSHRSGDLDIYTYDLEHEELNQITHNKVEDGFTQYPHWSPDSKRIVYHNSERGVGNNIWVMDADGGRKERITPIHQGVAILDRGPPRWSPTGKYIMYDEAESTPDRKGTAASRLIIQSVFTGNRVVHNFPKTSVFFGGVAWMGDDNTVLLGYKEPESTRNIYRYDLDSRKMTKLTDFPQGHALFPHWIEGPLAVSPLEKATTRWGYLKQKLAK